MRVGRGLEGVVANEGDGDRWVVVPGPWGGDVLAFLAAGEAAREAADAVLASGAPPAAAPAGLPFAPRSFRDFSLWEAHWEAAARTLVRRFAKPYQQRTVALYEKVARRTFPKLLPEHGFHDRPCFYIGNPTTFHADGEDVRWPRHSEFLDYELELGIVIAHEVRDCTPSEGLQAIGGFVVVNDWSARDTQWRDSRDNPFGGMVKAKSFATSMGTTVVTADALLDRWTQLTGRARVNGEVWSESSAARPEHDLGALVAYAADGEPLRPGDLLATGTLPGGCGLELDRWVKPGDTVTLELDGVGSVSNQVVRP